MIMAVRRRIKRIRNSDVVVVVVVIEKWERVMDCFPGSDGSGL